MVSCEAMSLSSSSQVRLCNVRFTSVKADINLKSVTVNSRTGDFNPSSLAQVVNTETINELIVRTWIDRACTSKSSKLFCLLIRTLSAKRKSTLIFCVNISHVMALTTTFRGYGIDARYLYSETPMAERKALVASFKAGEFPVLVNCGRQKHHLPDDCPNPTFSHSNGGRRYTQYRLRSGCATNPFTERICSNGNVSITHS
jgi:hypothetical protein